MILLNRYSKHPAMSKAFKFSNWIVVLFFLLSLFGSFHVMGQYELLDSLNDKEGNSRINMFDKFDWTVTVGMKNGQTRQLQTRNPDTIRLGNVSFVLLSTKVHFGPKLKGQTIALTYSLSGALRVRVNGDDVLTTGSLNRTNDAKLSKAEVNGFVNLSIKDSLEKFEVLYLPDPRINILYLELKLAELSQVQRERENALISDHSDYSLGYYYLSFGIVFMLLFLFSRDKTENLYFSLFCLFTFFTCISSAADSFISSILMLFCFVFSIEFMSFFLAKVLRNKNKSKISLLVRGVIAAVCFYPPILYSFFFMGKRTTANMRNMPVPVILLLVFLILFSISAVSSVYYLIRGFRQKRWEARVIVFICSLALGISMLLPFIAQMISSEGVAEIIENISSIGIYLYPLGAVIVLGKTNRLNQQKLMQQVTSIKELSRENLEKEKEKQQMLETQNTELEHKVAERTRDIIRQKQEIEIKKQEIEIKNKAITDNINYAQRIQSAILPDIKLIYKALAESFILFLPKDIVSGDFYAFAEKNGRVIIIAGDCTGHGVSGAFMSMIASSLLNQIINERGIDEPAGILNHLNTMIIATLRQNENDSASADGMDISVCSFDLNKNELQYAGANRPLWVISNKAVEVYKPDKFPIGGLQAAYDRVFKNHTIQLQQNDTIYIFTDGYADQFGGEKGKKLMTAKFKEALLAIQHMSMREQEKYLGDYFDKWKADNEQVDDVLVIGVRI